MTLFQITAMFFLHIIDDFVLQAAWLSKGKQKSWWTTYARDPLYRYDYIMALAIHGLSWAFMIMLPVAWSCGSDVSGVYIFILLLNAAIHSVVDHLKANRHKLNLIEDQLIHMVQIAITATFFILY